MFVLYITSMCASMYRRAPYLCGNTSSNKCKLCVSNVCKVQIEIQQKKVMDEHEFDCEVLTCRKIANTRSDLYAVNL